jgi:amidase
LARSVRDSALMLDVTSGAEPTSRYPLMRPQKSFIAAADAPVATLRIGVALRSPGGIAPTDEIGAAVERAATALRRAGHTVGEFRYPESANIGEPAFIVWMSAVAEEIDYYRGRVGRDPRQDEMEALTWAGVALGKRCSAVDYVRARRALTAATRDMAAAFRDVDALLLPTTAELAVRTGQIDGRTDAFDLDRWNRDSYGYAPYTEIFNVTGQPAISLPLAQSSGGLPIGVQLAAPLGEDARLLALAAWFERELPWEQRLAELRRRFLD